MSDEADSVDNVEATNVDEVMHHKHPVVKLVREQIQNVEDPVIKMQDDVPMGAVTIPTSGGTGGNTDGGNQQERARGEDGISRRSSLGSRVWEKKGYCASSMMLLALIWLVLVYGAFIGANLCGSLSFKHKLCSGCGIGLGMVPGYNEAEQVYSRGVY